MFCLEPLVAPEWNDTYIYSTTVGLLSDHDVKYSIIIFYMHMCMRIRYRSIVGKYFSGTN